MANPDLATYTEPWPCTGRRPPPTVDLTLAARSIFADVLAAPLCESCGHQKRPVGDGRYVCTILTDP